MDVDEEVVSLEDLALLLTTLPPGAVALQAALSSIFSSKIAKTFLRLNELISLIQSQKIRILHFLKFFLRIFDEFFSGFRAKFQKIVTCVAFSIKFAKTNQKFAENSEFCANYSLLFKIIHWCP